VDSDPEDSALISNLVEGPPALKRRSKLKVRKAGAKGVAYGRKIWQTEDQARVFKCEPGGGARHLR
jgi:hypothetical protein